MKRRAVYAIVAVIGFLSGPLALIVGDTCSLSPELPLLACGVEDLTEPIILGVVFAMVSLSAVGTIDLLWAASKGRGQAVPRWRRWLYALLLLALTFPMVLVVVQQATGRFSSDSQIIIFFLGTWILTLPIVADFIVWLVREFRGLRRTLPVAVVAVSAVGAYFASSHPALGCTNQASDVASCYTAMEIYIAHWFALLAMVIGFFVRPGDAAET